MTRAEQKAFKAYPKIEPFESNDTFKHRRGGFIEGYEQAEKDVVEKVANWLLKSENVAKCIKEFRKAMEE